MTIFYYPTLLGFVASTLAYVINPDLASNGVYTGDRDHGRVLGRRVGLVSRRHSGRREAGIDGLVIGTLIPGALLVVLGIVFLVQGNPSAAPMDGEPSAAGVDRASPAWC